MAKPPKKQRLSVYLEPEVMKALAAHDNRVPFHVAAPLSTVDWRATNGDAIPIEERSAEEVRNVVGLDDALDGPLDILGENLGELHDGHGSCSRMFLAR